jgi:hypothetical protein
MTPEQTSPPAPLPKGEGRRAVPRGEGKQPLPTGTVSFLFTDIEGSTPKWECEPERMAGALEEVRKHEKFWRREVTPEKVERISKLTRSKMDETDYQAAWEEGRAMTLEQAVAYALEDYN